MHQVIEHKETQSEFEKWWATQDTSDLSIAYKWIAWNAWLAAKADAPEGDDTIPHGWKLVPITPTIEMIRAANIGSSVDGGPMMAVHYPAAVGPEDVYEAMVKTAPTPQSSPMK